MATRVKTPADTVKLAVKLLALQVTEPNGQLAVTKKTKFGAPFNVAIRRSATAKLTRKQFVTVLILRWAIEKM